MNTDRCDSEVEPGVRCSRDLGHDGPHMIEGEIPPAIGRLIEGVMQEHEAAAKRARAAMIRYNALSLVALGAILVTVLNAIFHP